MTALPERDHTFTVERLGAADADRWDAYVHSHPASTTYHRYAWREIFGETFGYRSFYLLARDAVGTAMGCLPLFLVRSPFGRRLVAVPFRDRGGILWSHESAFHAILEEVRDIAAQERASFVELKSITDDYPMPPGMHKHLYWLRSAVDLRGLDADLLWKKIGSKTRNMIRQAGEASLTFRDLTGDPRAFAIWHDLHLITQRRQGLPPFPRVFFRRMIRSLREENGVRVFAVYRAGEPVSATIVLLHGGTGIYGYSGSSKAAQQYRPNDFMLFNVMKWLLENRYREFDLGSDAPAQESLLFFKRKWLGVQTPIPVYVLGDADFSLADSSHSRYDLARRVFQHLPLPVLRATGALTRFFG